MKGKFILFALALCAFNSEAQVSYVPAPVTLYEGGYEYGGSFSLFQTSQVVDPDGEASSLLENERFRMIDVDFGGKYGLTDRLEILAGMKVRSNSSNEIYQSQEFGFTTTGLHSVYGGFKYSFPNQGGFLIALEGEYLKRLYQPEEGDSSTAPETLVLGDEGDSAAFGFSAAYMSPSRNYLSGRMLYRNPGQNLSSEVLTEVEAAMAWDYVALFAGAQVVSSLGQDAYAGDPENKPQTESGPGNLFNSVNRSWTAPYGGISVALGKEWRMEGRVLNRVSGSSTDLGNTFIISVFRRVSDAKIFQKKNAAFKEYTVEASVVKLSKSGGAVIIDAGANEGLKKNSRIDFYFFDYTGGNELIASGAVVKLGASKSLVKISKKYSKKRVEEGTLARGGLIKTNLP